MVEMAMGEKGCHWMESQSRATLANGLMEVWIPNSRIYYHRLVAPLSSKDPAVSGEGFGYNDIDENFAQGYRLTFPVFADSTPTRRRAI
jgi:hypothetical protein